MAWFNGCTNVDSNIRDRLSIPWDVLLDIDLRASKIEALPGQQALADGVSSFKVRITLVSKSGRMFAPFVPRLGALGTGTVAASCTALTAAGISHCNVLATEPGEKLLYSNSRRIVL